MVTEWFLILKSWIILYFLIIIVFAIHFISNICTIKIILCLKQRLPNTFTFYIESLFFTYVPNGLLSAPIMFTKLMNPVLEILGQYGYMNVAYIENSLLLKDTDDEWVHRECTKYKWFNV